MNTLKTGTNIAHPILRSPDSNSGIRRKNSLTGQANLGHRKRTRLRPLVSWNGELVITAQNGEKMMKIDTRSVGNVSQVKGRKTVKQSVVQSNRTDKAQTDNVDADDVFDEGAQAAPVPVPIEQLTADCVTKINQEADNEVTAWLKIGKLVTDYVATFKKVKCKGDAYKILASSGCGHKDKQLRAYARCSELHHDLGEAAPKLPMTHYIAVLNHNINVETQLELLREAHDKKLSVSAFKERVAAAVPKKKVEKPVGDPVVAFQTAATDLLDAFSALHNSQPVKDDQPLPNLKIVQDAIIPMVRQMVASGYFRPDQCHPKKTDKTRFTMTLDKGVVI